jgi:hypothetical protein
LMLRWNELCTNRTPPGTRTSRPHRSPRIIEVGLAHDRFIDAAACQPSRSMQRRMRRRGLCIPQPHEKLVLDTLALAWW